MAPPGLSALFTARTGATALAVGLLALASIYIAGFSDLVAIVWLPNAAVIAFLFLSPLRRSSDVLTGHVIGVLAANLLMGMGGLSALGMAGANLVEVTVALWLLQQYLRPNWPHHTEEHYFLFLALMAVAATASGLAGALVSYAMLGEPFLRMGLDWFIGSLASLVALVPLMFQVLARAGTRYPITVRELAWSGIGLTAVTGICIAGVLLDDMLRAFFAIVLVYTWLCVKQGRLGTIATSAALLVMITFLGVANREMADVVDALRLGSDITVFAVLYFTVVVPGNVIAALVGRLTAERQRQRELSILKSDLIGNLSHEINTPLNAIHGVLQLLRSSELDARQIGWTGAAIQASETLQANIRQILEMARLEDPNSSSQTEAVSLDSHLDGWVSACEALVRTSGKDIEITRLPGRGDCSRVVTGPRPLDQIVLNFVSNAVKYSTKGRIGIGYQIEQGWFHIDVYDEGKGIAEEDIGAVFERFRRLEAAENAEELGVGLGLAISRDLARQMGGDIVVTSEVGKGSQFRLTLPSN